MHWPNRIVRVITSDRAQATVEMAVILPVLALIIFGSLEFARVFNAWIIITQASREGARVGATQCAAHATCSTTVGAWVEDSLTGLDVAAVDWDMTPGPYSAGGTLTVNVDYDVPIITPLISLLTGATVPVHAQTSMRIE